MKNEDLRKESDEALFVAIRRTQEEMRLSPGVDLEKIQEQISKAVECCFLIRPALIKFQYALLDLAHKEEGWWKRLKLIRKINNNNNFKAHVAECETCSLVFEEAIRHMNNLFKKEKEASGE